MKCLVSLFMVALCVSLFSCSNDAETGATYNKTFITGYMNPEQVVVESIDAGVEVTFRGDVITSGDVFDDLSKAYNDLSYNRYTTCGPRIAISDALSLIKVETIEYFDATHQAGSDISDLIECQYISYYDYIQSGYKEAEKNLESYSDMMEYYLIDGAKLFKYNLSGIDYSHMNLVAPNIIFKFKQAPNKSGKYQFKLIFQTKDNTIESLFECEF